MTKMKFIILFLFSAIVIYSSNFQDFLDRVNSISSLTDKQTVVDSFINYAQGIGIPYIENYTANFLYRGNTPSAAVAGDHNGWNGSAMTKLTGTNLWYQSLEFENDARIDYKLVINGNWILDPLNPNTIPGGFGPNSELAMPGYVQPVEINFNPSLPKGKLTSHTIYSAVTTKNYSVSVYTPFNYDTSKTTTYSTVYFQDGGDYLNLGSSKNVIDNLIAENRIEEVIAVFVRPTNRNDEYAFANRFKYSQFFAEELVPIIDSIYSTKKDPMQRLVMGDSFGGNIIALISYQYPDVFGLCGLHSAAFWPNNYEVYNMIISGDKKNIKYYSVWGKYESLYSNMRNFLSQMTSLGYEIDGNEFNEGHSWGLWRATTDLILEYFFPSNSVSVEELNIVESFELLQNYPNPFNPITSIEYSISAVETGHAPSLQSNVSLKVYDILGNETAELVNERKEAGKYKVNFDGSQLTSGVYFYKLQVGKNSQVRKMILLK